MNNNEYIIETNDEYHVYPSQLIGRYGINLIYAPFFNIWDILLSPLRIILFILYNIAMWFVYKGGRIPIYKKYTDILAEYHIFRKSDFRIMSHITTIFRL